MCSTTSSLYNAKWRHSTLGYVSPGVRNERSLIHRLMVQAILSVIVIRPRLLLPSPGVP
jgi:hypothetical protein